MKVITTTLRRANPQNMPGFVYFEDGTTRVRLSDEDWRELGKPTEIVQQITVPKKEDPS